MLVNKRSCDSFIGSDVILKDDILIINEIKEMEKEFPFLYFNDEIFNRGFIINHFHKEEDENKEAIIIVHYDIDIQRIITLSIKRCTMLKLIKTKSVITLHEWLDNAVNAKFPDWDDFEQVGNGVLFKINKNERLNSIVSEIEADIKKNNFKYKGKNEVEFKVKNDKGS